MTSVLENQEQPLKFHETTAIDASYGKAVRQHLKQYQKPTYKEKENIWQISWVLKEIG
jgi:hypothetical protein